MTDRNLARRAPEPPSDSYTCEDCGGTFTKGWSDEESAAEAAELWGPIDDPALVCDDCWQIIRPDHEPTSPIIREMWERSRAAWEEHSGRRLPPAKSSAQIINEAVQAVLNRAPEPRRLPDPSPFAIAVLDRMVAAGCEHAAILPPVAENPEWWEMLEGHIATHHAGPEPRRVSPDR